MTKCIINQCCEPARNFMLDIDLRTDQNVRINKVAGDILPLHDKIGEHHISVSLTYRQDNETKHINLPAFVSENKEERILCVAIPSGVYLSVSKDGKNHIINFLEYHINRHSEILTEEFGTKSVASTDRIQLILNIEDFNDEEGLNSVAVIHSLTKQVEKIEDWEKPIDLIFVDKGFLHFQEIIFLKKYLKENEKIITLKATREEYPTLVSLFKENLIELEIWNITIDGISNIRIALRSSKEVNQDIIYLYDDNDNFIAMLDVDPTGWTNASSWTCFGEELNRGHFPVIYLCSPTSERYYPASYRFTENELIIDISYFKEIDGQLQLWIERRTFPGACSVGSIYRGANGQDIGGPEIIKIPLGAPIQA